MQGRSFSGRERNCCFLNTKQDRFATISAVSGLDFPDDGRCIAVSDWDGDGDLDLWISNRNAPRLRFMRNDTPTENRSVVVRLRGNGTTCNRDAIGARVECYLRDESGSELRRIQTLRAGEGFLSQSSKWLHFGVGASTAAIEKIDVRWPHGEVQTFRGLEVGNRYLLVQGTEAAEPVEQRRLPSQLSAGEQVLPPESRAARVALLTRVLMPEVDYQLANGSVRTERFESGTPTLVNLWATWCAPCMEELSSLASVSERLLERGGRIVSLSVDSLSEPQISVKDVAAKLEGLNYPFDWGTIDAAQLLQLQEMHDQFFFQKRTLPLPTSFLIDSQGRLAIIYRGPVTGDQLLADMALLSASPEERIKQAARFPGRQLQHKRVEEVAHQADLQLRYHVAAWLEENGEHETALRHFDELAQVDPSWAVPHRHQAKLFLRQKQVAKANESAAKALKLDPRSAGAHNTMGLVRSREGDEQAAASHFRKAIELDDQFAEAHNNLGTVLASLGKIDSAGVCFQRAIRIDNRFAEAHTNLGRVYALKNDSARAIRHFQLAIRIDPKYVEAYNNLGTMFARRGDLQKAIQIYREGLRLDPAHVETRQNHDRAMSLLNAK